MGFNACLKTIRNIKVDFIIYCYIVMTTTLRISSSMSVIRKNSLSLTPGCYTPKKTRFVNKM